MGTIRLKEESTPLRQPVPVSRPAAGKAATGPAVDPKRQHPAALRRRTNEAGTDLRKKNAAEACSGCGVALGPGETAFVWESTVVCGSCYQRRQAAHILAAVTASRMPALATVAEAAGSERSSWSSAARRFLRRPIGIAATVLRR